MSDLIKALQDNEKPFGLMTEEMQAKAEEIECTNFNWFSGANGWLPANPGSFSRSYSYHLRPDYAEKPKVVECEVIEVKGWLCVEMQIGHEKYTAMDSCIAHPDFDGFLFKDTYGDEKHMTPWLEIYKVVTHASHVLFKGATK